MKSKMKTQLDIVWTDAVYKVCGADISIEWTEDGNCIVAGIMLFLYEEN